MLHPLHWWGIGTPFPIGGNISEASPRRKWISDTFLPCHKGVCASRQIGPRNFFGGQIGPRNFCGRKLGTSKFCPWKIGILTLGGRGAFKMYWKCNPERFLLSDEKFCPSCIVSNYLGGSGSNKSPPIESILGNGWVLM